MERGNKTHGLVRIGILGGTFDPVHMGHLVVAEEIREQLGLNRVIFVPAACPPHKVPVSTSDSELRYAMVVLATEDNPCFETSDIEIKRSGKSYTIDTVSEFKDLYGQGCQIFFIMGADSIFEISTWKDPDRLLDLCTVVVTTRPDFDLDRIDERLRHRVKLATVTDIGISSTEIRRRVKEGRSIRYLVPEKVEEYIHRNGLYR